MKKSALTRIMTRHAIACDLDVKTARVNLGDFFVRVALELEAAGRFTLPGVGTWYATKRKARTLRNPVTRELMQVPETRGVRFKAAKRGVFAR